MALLLRLFPRARFIYVHRYPLTTFQSAAHMANTYCEALVALIHAVGNGLAGIASCARIRLAVVGLAAFADWYCYLQRPTPQAVTDFILDQFDLLYRTYIQDRKLVPPGGRDMHGGKSPGRYHC
jgi:hypothetical protein